MTLSGPSSITRAATRFVLVVLTLVAVLPPMLWLVGSGLVEHSRVRTAAATMAWWLAQSGPTTSPGAAPGLLLALQGAAGLPVEGSRVHWAAPAQPWAVTAGVFGEAPGWPAMDVSAAAGDAAVTIQHSLRPLLLQALWVGLASSALALAGWGLGIHRAVGLLQRAENRLRSVASLDPLTGLLNRDGLRRRLQRALERNLDRSVAVGVLVIDVDRFGLINDTLGQAVGDELLRDVANRIRGVTRAGDGLARLGGDQFAVHVDTLTGLDALTAMARNLRRAFDAPYALDGREVVTTASIGVVLAGPRDHSVDALLHHAEQTVRLAKKQGGNRIALHEPGEHANDGAQRLDLEQRLYGALGAGQFFIVYQPIVDAATEQTGTVEALLRWQDPGRGVVSPTEFILSLEQTGLIVPVGRWVLTEACRQVARWPGRGADGAPMNVSVNLSPLQFAEPDLLQMVSQVLRETGLEAQRLQLEVTEGLLLDPTPQTLRKIEGLAKLGVRLAVDDFGMGYSSLMYLKRFRLHTLKIDRMFVRDIVERPQDLTIVRAIVDLGHGLGMRVTAEGVETRAQGDALRQLGCDSLQGYLYGRPALPQALASTAAVRSPAGAAPAAAPAADQALDVAQPA